MQGLIGRITGTSCIHENGTQAEAYEKKSIADIRLNHYPCFVAADKEERSMTIKDQIHHIGRKENNQLPSKEDNWIIREEDEYI